jgi:hypothetical protein
MSTQEFPPGWDAERVREVLATLVVTYKSVRLA